MRRSLPHSVGTLACLVVLAAAGQLPVDQLFVLTLHHTFHLLLPTLAFGVFAAFVGRDIARFGWPQFTWSLGPTPTLRDGSHGAGAVVVVGAEQRKDSRSVAPEQLCASTTLLAPSGREPF